MSEQNINSIRSKFKSGNDVPVTRAWITREEYIAIEELQARVKELEAQRDELLKYRIDHDAWCEIWPIDAPCKCGLDDLIAKIKAEQKK